MGRPRVHQEERVTTAVRVPKTLHDRVRAVADERQVGMNLLVVRALEEYLDRLVPVEEVVRTRAPSPGEGRTEHMFAYDHADDGGRV